MRKPALPTVLVNASRNQLNIGAIAVDNRPAEPAHESEETDGQEG